MDLIYANDNKSTQINIGQNNVPYISFKKLDQTGLVINGFSTRCGGVSEGYLGTMNLGFARGDDDEKVFENYKLICESMAIDYTKLVTTNQTHTTNVRVVTKEDAGKGIVTPRDYSDIDGLVTNERNLPLITYYADCVPIYFLDTVNKVIGLVHSGWKGTVGRIGKVTVERMVKEFDSNPKNIMACIGPSICGNCYEIGGDVAIEFEKEFRNNIDKILVKKDNGKYMLNLWETNRIILLETGIPERNISVTDLCTCCNPDFLFSHRASKGNRGSLAAFLMLK